MRQTLVCYRVALSWPDPLQLSRPRPYLILVDVIELSTIKLVDLIEPYEILVDPIELTELCPVERPKVDLNDSTRRETFMI